MQDRFVQTFDKLPELLAKSIKPLLGQSFSGHITKIQLADLCQKTHMDENSLLLALLPIAAALASPPISEFYVGAIAKGGSGDIYMGANLELAGEALFHSVHAEQSAISHAWLKGETCITDIIVNASPCGHCRQFINELVNGSDIKIHLTAQPSQNLAYYLPYAFGPKDLNIVSPLLTKQNTQLKLTTEDPLYIAALNQANQSYAPYSGNHSAVVIEIITGEIFAGRYAENAAFNPSMLPLQMALSNLLRHNHSVQNISRVVLLESSSGKISLLNATRDALKDICKVQLEHIVAVLA